MAQLTDDRFAADAEMLRVADALDRLARRLTVATGIETVAVAEALGRVLAEDVVAAFNVPPHDNSAVDGYAVFVDDLAPDAETVLPVTGRVTAGSLLDRPGRRGEAVRIFTGAPMPEGFDTVMMQEDCRVDGDRVAIRPGITRGANRRRAGEDIAAGSVILHAGRRLRPQDIGLAASTGRDRLAVRRPLRAAVFSTGDEVRDPGSALAAGCIYDSNRYILGALLRQLGCAVTDLGILPDRLDAIGAALGAAATGHDLIVTSGGMSVGEEDHVKAAVEALGSLHFWRLAIKPGRPVALGEVGGVPFIGLPGNPVAVMVTFLRIARPMVLRLAGATETEPRWFQVRAGFDFKKKPGRREFLRVRLERAPDGALVARQHPNQGSGVLSSMVDSDGLVEVDEDTAVIAVGDPVDFLPFREVMG